MAVGALISAPIGYWIWMQFWPTGQINQFLKEGPIYFMLLMVSIFILHEMSHLLAFPGFGFSKDTYVGFDPKGGVPYVTHFGLITRNRFVLAILLPILTLSIAPLVYAIHFQEHVSILAGVSILNFIGSGGDLIVLGYVLKEIPSDWHFQGGSHGPLINSNSIPVAEIVKDATIETERTHLRRNWIILASYLAILACVMFGGFLIGRLEKLGIL